MGSHHPIRKLVAPEPVAIPDRLYFRIGDVARLCQVPAYVLRFWETEFPSLKPNKGGTGQRLYRRKDVEMALRIKTLLYDQGYTIPGARQVFKSETKPKEAAAFPGQEHPSDPAAHITDTGAPGPSPLRTLDTATTPDIGETIRRRAQQESRLHALRDDLRALLAQLAAPISLSTAIEAVPAPASAPTPAKSPRPRLVLEPRPPSQRPAPQSLRPDPPQLQQRDLFSVDTPDPTE